MGSPVMIQIALAAAALATGCAASPKPPSTGDIGSSYRIGSSAEVSHAEAPAVLAQQIESASTRQVGALEDGPIHLLKGAPPKTPPEAMRSGIEGVVRVRITFREDGTVSKVDVVSSPGEVLSAAVVEAVSQWRIAPRAHNLVAMQNFNFVKAP
jgi:TonB family protein